MNTPLEKRVREPHKVKKKSFHLSRNRTHDGLDLPLLCRLSYEVENRGEEKVRVHMNVVPRSIMNTNGGTEN